MNNDTIFILSLVATITGGIALLGCLIETANYFRNAHILECYSLLKDKDVADIILACKVQ